MCLKIGIINHLEIKMTRLKQTVRILSLVLLIILAAVGIGITGAAPILSINKERIAEEIKIELVESREDDKELMELKDIK